MIDFKISSDDFKHNFFEKKIMLIRNAFRGSYDWSDLNKDIFSTNHENPYISMMIHNKKVEESFFIKQINEVGIIRKFINHQAVHKILEDGGSMILNRIHSKSLKINNINSEISRFVKEMTISNGYLAFGEQESFGAHWDTHDVFAVQLIGRKRWVIYEPTFELPLSGQSSKDHKNSILNKKPIFDEIINSGDILYIPRGWWHTAIPLNEETFHIAVGVHPYKNRDYISWLLEKKAINILDFRKSFDYKNSESRSDLAREISNLILNNDNLDEFNEFILENKFLFNDPSVQIVRKNDELNYLFKTNNLGHDGDFVSNGIRVKLNQDILKKIEDTSTTELSNLIKCLEESERKRVIKIFKSLVATGHLSVED